MAQAEEEQPMSGNNTRGSVEIFAAGWDCLLNFGRKVDETETLRSANHRCL